MGLMHKPKSVLDVKKVSYSRPDLLRPIPQAWPVARANVALADASHLRNAVPLSARGSRPNRLSPLCKIQGHHRWPRAADQSEDADVQEPRRVHRHWRVTPGKCRCLRHYHIWCLNSASCWFSWIFKKPCSPQCSNVLKPLWHWFKNLDEYIGIDVWPLGNVDACDIITYDV